MDTVKVLWIDLRLAKDEVGFDYYLSTDWVVTHLSDSDQVIRETRANMPQLLCFEYDYPDISSLAVLRQIRHLFPMIPIIMLTEQHSEALAIWALRIRVSDYFVKPLKPQTLVDSAKYILSQTSLQNHTMSQPDQQSKALFNPIPMEVRFPPSHKKRTQLAHTYIETHYHEKIYEEQLAQFCGMNVSTFSRCFKKEYGISFRKYLINYRISKAKELLKHPNALVVDIAYAVGFDDPSYFTRTFGRLVGTCPSRFHEEHKKIIREQNLEKANPQLA